MECKLLRASYQQLGRGSLGSDKDLLAFRGYSDLSGFGPFSALVGEWLGERTTLSHFLLIPHFANIDYSSIAVKTEPFESNH
jgi:hypothetical protein